MKVNTQQLDVRTWATNSDSINVLKFDNCYIKERINHNAVSWCFEDALKRVRIYARPEKNAYGYATQSSLSERTGRGLLSTRADRYKAVVSTKLLVEARGFKKLKLIEQILAEITVMIDVRYKSMKDYMKKKTPIMGNIYSVVITKNNSPLLFITIRSIYLINYNNWDE